jgi:hypothetical protein
MQTTFISIQAIKAAINYEHQATPGHAVPLGPTTHERRTNVARMRHSFSLEGLQPDDTDAALQAAYIKGTVTLADMLAHATVFALRCAAREST